MAVAPTCRARSPRRPAPRRPRSRGSQIPPDARGPPDARDRRCDGGRAFGPSRAAVSNPSERRQRRDAGRGNIDAGFAAVGLARVSASLRYTRTLNTSPAVIGATPFSSAAGARGAGVKIAIVDDGVDPANPFFDPTGFAYPDGFPKGRKNFITEKIIVARSFAPPGAPARSSRPFDRSATFHGTHVAGIAAGVAGTTATKGLDHPETAGLSGVAPQAWIGNYRVFNVPTPAGDVANTPEIVAAFEQAVADGMDVINFSGGGPEVDPALAVV